MTTMRSINIQAIILRKRNIGDFDQFITLYSPEIGFLEARARGARKIKSNFTGHLELLTICKVQLYKGNRAYSLLQCQTIEPFKNIRDKLELSTTAFVILELFLSTAETDEDQCESMFHLLTETISQITSPKRDLIVESFKLKLLEKAGALPDITECSSCHRRWNKADTIHNDHEGHLYCTNCKPPHKPTEELSFNSMKLAHYTIQSPYTQVTSIEVKQEQMNELQLLTNNFWHNYTNRELQSQKFVARINYHDAVPL